MTAAMILCAGLGTRLRPLSEWCAKPVVPIGDAPAVEHVRRRLGAYGRIVVNVHHRPDDLRSWAPSNVAISDEPELLGTAGGLAQAGDLLGPGDVLVWNGDILCDLDPERLHHDDDATLAIAPRPAGEGNVGVDARGRVVRLRTTARFGEEVAGGDFLGIHRVGARLRARLPERGCLVGDVYLPALADGVALGTVRVTEPFRDIGTVASYVAANRAWLGDRASWSAEPIADVAIDGSIIGKGARIEADALRCIVWPGAKVTKPIADAIVTPFGTVPL